MQTGWLLEIRATDEETASAILARHGLHADRIGGVLSFSELHDGAFPLDITTEAFDFLTAHQIALCDLGASLTLYFYDSLGGHGGSFVLDPEMSQLLHKLGIRLEIFINNEN